MNKRSTEKLYCYVDETGQDTKGRLFIVVVIVLKKNRDRFYTLLKKIEILSGKKATKWSKTKQKFKVAYIWAIISLNDLPRYVEKGEIIRQDKEIYFWQHMNTKDYMELTLKTIAKVVRSAMPVEDYKVSVFIDGLSRPDWRKTSSALRRWGLKTEKVRGVEDESSPFIRLADSTAGFIREKVEGKDYAVRLYDQAKNNHTLVELR